MAIADRDLVDLVQSSVLAHQRVDAESAFDHDALNGDAHLPIGRISYLELRKPQSHLVVAVGYCIAILARVLAVFLVELVLCGAAHLIPNGLCSAACVAP